MGTSHRNAYLWEEAEGMQLVAYSTVIHEIGIEATALRRASSAPHLGTTIMPTLLVGRR